MSQPPPPASLRVAQPTHRGDSARCILAVQRNVTPPLVRPTEAADVGAGLAPPFLFRLLGPAVIPNGAFCRRDLLFLLLAFSLLTTLPISAQESVPFTQALAAFQSGDYASAALLFAKAESASPGTTDALLFEAKARVHLEQFPAADAALRKYLQSHADSEEALYLLGFVLHKQNKAAESLEVYTRAAQHRHPTGDDLKIVGLNYVLLNDYPDAIKWLEKAVEEEPQSKEAWYFLGRAYYTRQRIREAHQAFLRALELDPRDPKSENNLGLVLEAEAQLDAALDAYRKAIAWQESAAQASGQAASANVGAGFSPSPVPPAESAATNKATASAPKNDAVSAQKNDQAATAPKHDRHLSEQPYLNLGSLLLQQSRLAESIPPLQKAVDLAPADPTCRMRLGMAYLRSGKLAEAQPQLEEAVRLAPDDPAGHYQLGKLYKELKLMAKAQSEFAKTESLHQRAASPPQH